MSQEEMGSGKVQGGRQQKRSLQRQRLFFGMEEACATKQEVQTTKVDRTLLGKNLRFVQRIQRAASAKHA